MEFTGPGLMMDGRPSCESFHRQQARGGVHMVYMQGLEAPDIRWSVLAEAQGPLPRGASAGNASFDLEKQIRQR